MSNNYAGRYGMIERMKQGVRIAAGSVLIGLAVFFLVAIAGHTDGDYDRLVRGAAVLHIGGRMSAWTAYWLRGALGSAAFGIPVLLALSGFSLVRKERVPRLSECSLLLIFVIAGAAVLLSIPAKGDLLRGGGAVGSYLAGWLSGRLGNEASYYLVSGCVVCAAAVVLLMIVFPRPRTITVERSGLSKRFRIFSLGREKGSIPLLEIGRMTMPWVVKKRILVFEEEAASYPQAERKMPLLSENETEGFNTTSRDGQIPLLLEDESTTVTEREENQELVLGSEAYRIEYDSGLNIHDRPSIASNDEIRLRVLDVDKDEEGEENSTAREWSVEDAPTGYSTSPKETNYEPTIEQNDEADGCGAMRVFDDIPMRDDYEIPASYLSFSRQQDAESWKTEIRKNSALLKATLADFGIEADVVNVVRGPVITLYEMQIGPGIKVTRVASLADDIALALAAARVRIVAPIPGKSAIGVEIPNRVRETVTLGDIVNSKEFKSFEGRLAVALGKDILGKPVLLDLKRLPHLLIAGATGSGKSVCVNAIITSLLYRYDPNYLRFILIDPKMVELQIYNGLPHLLTPVVVDPYVAPTVLKWAMYEMERRYRLLSSVNARDIDRYNERVAENGNFERLPYIVIIIDEMADLMMTSKEVEGCITRIAQKARAVGIHLVVATQRPSVDIITGIIKANFPARIAFQVAQKTDSRTIIDQNGAEKLLGRGDMLYQSPTSSFPVRVQGGFISEEEIERIVGHCKSLGSPSYIDIEECMREDEEAQALESFDDDLFNEAMKIVAESRKASASYLQRRLSIGYNRAARIIEEMEERGYIGPQIGSKPREVYI